MTGIQGAVVAYSLSVFLLLGYALCIWIRWHTANSRKR